ncbi:MAG: DUF2238 domain-containing protein [Campylobacterales bacterium]
MGARAIKIAVVAYGLWWLLLAIAPYDRGDWLLENLLVFLSWPLIYHLWKRRLLSSEAIHSILLFLAFHAVGAHYTYAQTTPFRLISDLFGFERNHYDRLVHFLFGFLLLLPAVELIKRHIAQPLTLLVAAAFLVTLSTLFEIIEWIVVLIVDPNLGIAYLGAQGDIWDAQKDMLAAFLGIVAALPHAYKRLMSTSSTPSRTTTRP